MSIRIKILPEDLVNKIAAGEVVERPASVVKELVENAIDAGGRNITIEIRGGGRSLIQVIDDGSGMSREDALLSIERHATSKLATSADLFAIRTLGFRGEALAAIAGVSKLEIVTRTAGAAAATRVVVQGGTIRNVEEVGAPVGTSIAVRDLFFNTPARLKFMKSVAIETGHIIDLATRLAMASEGVAMRLVRGGETLLQASAVTTGRDRLVELLGPEVVGHLHPFRAERAGIRVYGHLSAPDLNRSGWSDLYAFVNGRFLRDRGITRAVAEAYRGIIPKGRYPVAMVFLELHPQEVDVNVHPGKIEVRFARPRTVSDLIIEAMRGALVHTPWRGGAGGSARPPAQSGLFADPGLESPRQAIEAELLLGDILEERGRVGMTAPAADSERLEAQAPTRSRLVQFAPEPDPAEERARLESLEEHALGETGHETYGWRWRDWQQRTGREPEGVRPSGAGTAPSRPVPAGGERSAVGLEAERAEGVRPPEWGPAAGVGAATRGERPGAEGTAGGSAGEGVGAPAGLEVVTGRAGAVTQADVVAVALVGREATDVAAVDRAGREAADSADGAGPSMPAADGERRDDASSGSVAPMSGRGRPLERPGILPGLEVRNFSRMRIIGQYANCFILCQDGDELVIIDQHAAHERVTFEQLKAAYEGIGARNQLLLTPKIVDLPRREAELLTDYLEELQALGLEVEPFGGTTFAVKALPVALQDEDPAALLTELAGDLTADVARQPLHERIYLMLATMACHGSIRANRKMAMPEMEALLKLLDGTDFSFACPHGRPLIVRSSRREVEKLFKRT